MTRTRALLLTLLIAVVVSLLFTPAFITPEPMLPERRIVGPDEGNVAPLPAR
jgi:hypothetical protein